MTEAQTRNHKTTIKISLPYCLYRVDSRLFELHDEYSSKIKFIKVETTPNRMVQNSRNIEVLRDRWGINAHSDVEICTKKKFGNQDEAANFALEVINDFIVMYRYHDREAIHLVPLTREDLLSINVLSGGKGSMSISFAGGITIAAPQRIREVSENIEKYLDEKEEIPLYEELLLNAEQYLYQVEYKHSVLESIIALEAIISEFVLKKLKEKGISTNKAKDYIKNIGLTGNVDVSLRLFLVNDDLPDDQLIEDCKTNITLRNKIVHEGNKEVSEKDARNTLEHSRKMISLLRSQF